MNFRFDFAGNFLSPVNISRRIHAANCFDDFSWTFLGLMDIPWSGYLANLHEYRIERLSSFTDFRAAEVPIHFPCRSIEHYLICFRQLPHCRISTPVMPTQTWPRRAPPAGTAAVKKRYTTATPTSARDVAAAPPAGTAAADTRYTTATTASAGSGQRRWPRPAAAAARTDALPPGTWQAPAAPEDGSGRRRRRRRAGDRGRRGRACCPPGRGRGRRQQPPQLAAACAGGEDGRAAPRDVAVAGACSAVVGTGALPAGQFCMPAVKRQIEIKDLKRNSACHRCDRTA